jgi:hypothetical protein
MKTRPTPVVLLFALGVLGGCASTPSSEGADPSDREPEKGASERPVRNEETNRTEATSAGDSRERRSTEALREGRSEAVTNTERAAARRPITASSSQGGAADVSRLVEQLREAARELATLRAANARLKTERERAEKAAQNAAESEETRRAREKAAADLKVATEDLRKLKAAVDRLGEDVAVEKRLRLEAEATATQLREQLRTLARAVSELAADPRSDDERRRSRD